MEFDLFDKLADLETTIFVLREEVKQKDIHIQALLHHISVLEDTNSIPQKDAECQSTLSNEEDKPQTSSEPVTAAGFQDVASIAETLKEASNSALQNVGYTFDERTGLYYDSKSGYYYDPENQLFYEPKSGVYYTYNPEDGKYTYHSSCDKAELRKKFEDAVAIRSLQQKPHRPPSKPSSSRSPRRRDRKRKHGRSRSRSNHHSRRHGRRGSSSDDDSYKSRRRRHSSGRSSSLGRSKNRRRRSRSRSFSRSRSNDHKSKSPAVELSKSAQIYPPTVRFAVRESQHCPVGTVYQTVYAPTTRNWGCIGRNAALCPILNFPMDSTLSAIHCELSYDQPNKAYSLVNYNVHSGTLINQRRMQENEMCTLCHGDIFRISATEFLVHIHERQDSCEECNQDLLLLRAASSARQSNGQSVGADAGSTSLEDQRLQFLNNLRDKYGLKLPKVKGSDDTTSKDKYKDRASHRRTIHKNRVKQGLEEPEPVEAPEKPAPVAPSTAVPVASDNLGAKLLSKMGWQPGQRLGKNETGILEPISASKRATSHAGLGSSNDKLRLPANATSKDVERARRMNVTRDRYARAN